MSQMPEPRLMCSITEEACCGTDPEPLQLFCDDDQTIVSSTRVQSPEHKQRMAFSIQEAAEYYRKLFQETLVTLREKVEAAKSLLAEERERMVMIQEEEQRFEEMIKAEYRTRLLLLTEEMELRSLRLPTCKFDLDLRRADQNQLMEFSSDLMQKCQEMMQRLRHLGRVNMSKLKASEAWLCEHLCSLQKIIMELEKKCGEPAITLTQNAKCYLKRSESALLQSLEPAQITDLSSCQIIGMSNALLTLQRRVTLDPDTAHPFLVLSKDLRSVGFGATPKSVPDTPGTFDFSASVLGAESFNSGRHYWEVSVGQATQWQLGICDCTEKENGMPGAPGDKVVLTGCMMGVSTPSGCFPPLRKLCLKKQMYKVGVFLDFGYKQVSFYDVTEGSLIYSFTDLTFRGAVKPVFSLCVPNGNTSSDSLTLSLPQTHS